MLFRSWPVSPLNGGSLAMERRINDGVGGRAAIPSWIGSEVSRTVATMSPIGRNRRSLRRSDTSERRGKPEVPGARSI